MNIDKEQPTLKNLVERILKKEPDDQAGDFYLLMLEFEKLPITEFESYMRWRPERPARIRLASADHFDLVMTCWERNQRGPVHDLYMNEGWIHPLHGTLREDRYRTNNNGDVERVASLVLDSRSFSYMNQQRTIHRYSNIGNQRAVSLHLYSERIDRWQELHPTTGHFIERHLEFDRPLSSEQSILS